MTVLQRKFVLWLILILVAVGLSIIILQRFEKNMRRIKEGHLSEKLGVTEFQNLQETGLSKRDFQEFEEGVRELSKVFEELAKQTTTSASTVFPMIYPSSSTFSVSSSSKEKEGLLSK